jgi:AraC-like DNA-binding protein
MKIVVRQEVSPLGIGTYSEWRPPHLTQWVELIWHYQGPSNHVQKRVLPNGRVELLVNFAEPYRVLVGAGIEWLAAAVLSGMQSAPFLIEQPRWQNVLAVRLRPAGAYSLIARPLSEVSGISVDLHDLVGRAARALAERCHGAGSTESRFRLAADWVGRRVSRSPALDPPIAWVAAEIERSGGAVSIADLRHEVGFSKARLAGTFREQIGVAPKLFARLVRFRRATSLLQDGLAALVDVALDSGYYDQPHMNAEFRELSGLAPREFLATRHRLGGGVTAFVP